MRSSFEGMRHSAYSLVIEPIWETDGGECSEADGRKGGAAAPFFGSETYSDGNA